MVVASDSKGCSAARSLVCSTVPQGSLDSSGAELECEIAQSYLFDWNGKKLSDG